MLSGLRDKSVKMRSLQQVFMTFRINLKHTSVLQFSMLPFQLTFKDLFFWSSSQFLLAQYTLFFMEKILVATSLQWELSAPYPETSMFIRTPWTRVLHFRRAELSRPRFHQHMAWFDGLWVLNAQEYGVDWWSMTSEYLYKLLELSRL